MELDSGVCYRALRTRDARFDGRFFAAVRTTGVFCRPICPAPTPKHENCTFVPSAAAAQELGFRPCLRCRPESSPGTPAWLGTSATVSRALRLISEGALDAGTVDELAERLGVGARHLRRLFLRHLGATPVAVAQTRRLLFAKKLLDETQLSMANVALTSGFSSVRRFNDAIKKTYDRSPRDLRRRSASEDGDPTELELRLSYRSPLRFAQILAYLGGRATPGVEFASADTYARTVELDDSRGWIAVTAPLEGDPLRVRIHIDPPTELIQLTERVRRIFDLGADPEPIVEHLGKDAIVGARLRALPGLRIPGAWDGFELAVRAILGQQVSVRGATTLAGRLASSFGTKLADAPVCLKLSTVFPTPSVLAEADLTGIGLPAARAEAIRSLSRAVADGTLRLDSARGLETSVEELCALPGIGPWTAQYIALRALREPDAFPAGDLGLRRAAAPPGAAPLTQRELETRAEAWRPWRAYAAMALWTEMEES